MKKNNFQISVIGAGRVGSALTYSLFKKGFKFLSVIDKDLKKAKKLMNMLQALSCSAKIKDLKPETNLLFITTPDDQIIPVANRISKLKKLNFKKLIVIHTSGTLTIDALTKLTSLGVRTISLHPIQTFPSGKNVNELSKLIQNIYFGVETDKSNLRTAKYLINSINSKMVFISKQNKPLYHIACVLASNYIVANLRLIELLSEKMGIQKTWKKAFKQLIYTTVNNSLKLSPAQALTGPIERGDLETIRKHLKEIKQNIPEILKVYSILGVETAKISLIKSSIKRNQFNKIVNLLKENL